MIQQWLEPWSVARCCWHLLWGRSPTQAGRGKSSMTEDLWTIQYNWRCLGRVYNEKIWFNPIKFRLKCHQIPKAYSTTHLESFLLINMVQSHSIPIKPIVFTDKYGSIPSNPTKNTIKIPWTSIKNPWNSGKLHETASKIPFKSHEIPMNIPAKIPSPPDLPRMLHPMARLRLWRRRLLCLAQLLVQAMVAAWHAMSFSWRYDGFIQ